MATGTLTKEYSLAKGLERNDILSLLYYLGMLTISGRDQGEIIFRVPNYVINFLYWKYFLNDLEQEKKIAIDTRRIAESIKAMAFEGNPAIFIAETEKVLEQLSNRDLVKFDEKYIKLVLIQQK